MSEVQSLYNPKVESNAVRLRTVSHAQKGPSLFLSWWHRAFWPEATYARKSLFHLYFHIIVHHG